MTRLRELAIDGAVRLTALVIAIVALAVPAWAYIQTSGPAAQVAARVAAPVIARRDVAHLYTLVLPRRAITVLTYHGIAPTGANAVSPEVFSEQMAALREAGFRTLTADQLADAVLGRRVRLPARPLVLTFDDGIKSVWVHGDAVLARYGFHGVVFTITGQVGHHQPYYLTWAEIEAMHRTGRWDFESHTRDGHDQIRTDAAGRRSPFLANRRWLSAPGRSESVGEWKARVAASLDGSIRDLVAHGLPAPRLFAFPFSAERATPQDDPAIAGLLRAVVRQRFAGALSDGGKARLLMPFSTREMLPRIAVRRSMSAHALLETVAQAADGAPRPSGAAWPSSIPSHLRGAAQ